MTPSAALPRGASGWQLILADLALILFLLTLSALPAAEAGRDLAEENRDRGPSTDIAPAQALFRAVPGGARLGEWLNEQGHDPRATLTIFVTHARGDGSAAWHEAQALAEEARAQGTRVRTIITAGTTPGLYASLAYDDAGWQAPRAP